MFLSSPPAAVAFVRLPFSSLSFTQWKRGMKCRYLLTYKLLVCTHYYYLIITITTVTIWLPPVHPPAGSRGFTCLAEARQMMMGCLPECSSSKPGSTCEPTGHPRSPHFCGKEPIHGQRDGICLGYSLWVLAASGHFSRRYVFGTFTPPLLDPTQ